MKTPHEKKNFGEQRCCMPSQERRFSCPLTNTIMEDPVSVPCCGANFERRALLRWMRKNGDRCPASGEPLQPSDLRPNATLQWEILYLERKNSQDKCTSLLTLWQEASSTRSVPSPLADMPPSMPRSPSSLDARDKSSNKRRLLKEASRCFRKGDLPPTLPRSQITRPCSPPLKRMDSAPSLPQRKNMDAFMDVKLTQGFFSHRSIPTRNATFLATPQRRANEIISVIDDVLAVLSDDEGY